jgi:hypothetical protein
VIIQKTKIEWADYDLTANRIIEKTGYIRIKVPNHPRATKQGYVLEHRVVMENHLKKHLDSSEDVHHINLNSSDNRIENLKVMIDKDHATFHNSILEKEILIKRAEGLIKHQKSIKIPRILIACKCGCGIIIENRDSKARTREYVHGHNAKGTTWKWRKNATH